MRNTLMDLLGGSTYDYADGNTTFISPLLEDYNNISILIKVSGVSGTGSTFTINEGLSTKVFSPVEHSSLTSGVVTMDAAEVIVNIDYSPFIKKYIKIDFNNNSETGTIDCVQIMAKQ